MIAGCGGDTPGGVGGGGSGACTNANDTAIGKPAMDTAASACGLACYADKDANPPKMCADCLNMNITKNTQKTLTTACNTCWTTVIICGIKNCSSVCLMNGATSAECRTCTSQAGCDSNFTNCAGL